MEIIVLNEGQMREVFTMKDAIQADKDALRIYSQGGADVPLRVNVPVPKFEGQSLYMPGYAGEAKALGVKIVSVYPKNIEKGLTSVPATMILVNDETGEVCSILDGTWLTRLRTGAVSGAATDILARADSKIMALFGTGGQAETQLEAVLNVRAIKDVRVFDLSSARCEDFCNRMMAKFGVQFGVNIYPVTSSDLAIEDADVITAVTTAKTPVFDGLKIKMGAHVNGVGAYTPEMRELCPTLITRADRLVVDTFHGALEEAGDLIHPLQEGLIQESDLIELGQIILGLTEGRRSPDEITVFKTVGSGVLDVVTARRIFEKAVEKNVGQLLNF